MYIKKLKPTNILDDKLSKNKLSPTSISIQETNSKEHILKNKPEKTENNIENNKNYDELEI